MDFLILKEKEELLSRRVTIGKKKNEICEQIVDLKKNGETFILYIQRKK